MHENFYETWKEIMFTLFTLDLPIYDYNWIYIQHVKCIFMCIN